MKERTFGGWGGMAMPTLLQIPLCRSDDPPGSLGGHREGGGEGSLASTTSQVAGRRPSEYPAAARWLWHEGGGGVSACHHEFSCLCVDLLLWAVLLSTGAQICALPFQISWRWSGPLVTIYTCTYSWYTHQVCSIMAHELFFSLLISKGVKLLI